MAVDAAQMVRVLRKMRAEITRINKERDAEVKKVEDQRAIVQMALLRHMEATNVKSIRTADGTASKRLKVTPSVKDWDVFYKFIYENKRADMLQRRVTSVAVVGYMKKNKKLPPGVNVMEEFVIRVVKPGEAEDLDDVMEEGE